MMFYTCGCQFAAKKWFPLPPFCFVLLENTYVSVVNVQVQLLTHTGNACDRQIGAVHERYAVHQACEDHVSAWTWKGARLPNSSGQQVGKLTEDSDETAVDASDDLALLNFR